MYKIKTTEKEGKNYINISAYSETKLGKKLSPGYPTEFQTLFGKIGNIRAYMDFIVTPNYPVELLSKKKLTSNDLKKIPNNKVHIANYWAAVAYGITERVNSDQELQTLLKESGDIPFTSFIVKKKMNNILKKKYKVIFYNAKMEKYISIVNDIRKLLQEDRYEPDSLNELINSYKDEPDKDIFEGIPHTIIVE